MSLPSPVASFPDVSSLIANSKSQANALMQSAWAQFSDLPMARPPAPAAAPAPAGTPAQQYGTLSGYGQGGQPAGGYRPSGEPSLDRAISALQRTETGYLGSYEENYGTLGPRDPETGRYAIGPLQILNTNIPQWTQAATGRSWTDAEIVAGLKAGNPEAIAAYNATGQYQVNQMLQNGYRPEEIAIEWHSGPGGLARYRNQRSAPRDFANGLATWGADDSYLGRFMNHYGA